MKSLKTIREAMGIPQTKFAKRIGVHRNTVRRWENGKSHPSKATLHLIAEFFRIQPNEIKEYAPFVE